VIDPRRAVLQELGVGRNAAGDRQVANRALESVLAALPPDMQEALADRQIRLSLPAIPGPKAQTGEPGVDWRFGLRKDQSLEDGVRETLNRQLRGEKRQATDDEVAAAVQYAIDSVGDPAVAEALGRAGGDIAATSYQTRMDSVLGAIDAAQNNPKLQAALAEYIGAPAGGTTVVAAPGDAAWMGQKPQLLAEVPVLKNATNGQLAIAGTGVGGAGLAFLADYLMGGDDRQPVAVVAPGGGGYR
jgi:hypothetical protein